MKYFAALLLFAFAAMSNAATIPNTMLGLPEYKPEAALEPAAKFEPAIEEDRSKRQIFGSPYSPYGIPYGSPYGSPYSSPYGSPYASPYGSPYGSPYYGSYGSPYNYPYRSPYYYPYH